METSFSAPRIVCGGCAGSIERALGTVPGVTGVSVDVAAKTLRVTHDERAKPGLLAATLDHAGYPATERAVACREPRDGLAILSSGSCCCSGTGREGRRR